MTNELSDSQQIEKTLDERIQGLEKEIASLQGLSEESPIDIMNLDDYIDVWDEQRKNYLIAQKTVLKTDLENKKAD